jgi:hypothetical protein
MNLTEADIDRIVAEVVRRLRALMASSSTEGRGRESLAANDVPNGNDPNRQRLPTLVHSSELKLSEKIITLQSLKGRLDGVTKVIVADRAIVTPAVKDELKDRKITWERTTKVRS